MTEYIRFQSISFLSSACAAIMAVLCTFTAAAGDELIMTAGDTVVGVIVSSTSDSVKIRVSHELLDYAHSHVSLYIFSRADVVQFYRGERIEAKVARKDNDKVTLITPTGITSHSNTEIKKVWYNRGGTLATTEMPVTGSQFRNSATSGARMGAFEPSLFVGLRLGSHYAFLEDWRDQFIGGGEARTTAVLQLGAEVLISISKHVSVGGGVEYFRGPTITIINLVGQPKDRVSALMGFGTLYISGPLNSRPDVRLGGGIDIGYMWAKETLITGNVSVEGTSATIVVRPKFRAEYRLSRNVAAQSEIGVLLANARNVEFAGGIFTGYNLDFTGVSLIGGLLLYTPF